ELGQRLAGGRRHHRVVAALERVEERAERVLAADLAEGARGGRGGGGILVGEGALEGRGDAGVGGGGADAREETEDLAAERLVGAAGGTDERRDRVRAEGDDGACGGLGGLLVDEERGEWLERPGPAAPAEERRGGAADPR